MPKSQTPTHRETTEEQRANVIILRSQGKTFAEIEAETGILRQTAQKIVKRFEQRKTLKNAPGRGRPPKLDERDLRRINRYLATNPRATLADITAEATLNAAPNTVKKALKELHYRSCISRRKFWLDKEMMKRRKGWCKVKKNWTLENWRKIVWCDEITIQLGDVGGGPDRVYRKPGTAYQRRYLQPTFRSGRKSIHFWACFTYGHRSPIVAIRQRGPDERTSVRDRGGMNSRQYLDEILRPYFLPFWTSIDGSKEGYKFMQDKSGPHRAGIVKAFLVEHGVEVLVWEGNSPDLNPIENIWRALRSRLKRRFLKARRKPTQERELIQAVQEEWERLDQGLFDRLADSMPERITEVLKANGGHTKW